MYGGGPPPGGSEEGSAKDHTFPHIFYVSFTVVSIKLAALVMSCGQ